MLIAHIEQRALAQKVWSTVKMKALLSFPDTRRKVMDKITTAGLHVAKRCCIARG